MLNSATIGDITFNQDNGNYVITSLNGLEMPPIRKIDYDLAGENFGLFVNALYGKRSFSIQGWVIGQSASDFISKRDDFQKALDITNGEIAINFVLANDRQVTINAILNRLDFMPEAGVVTASKYSASFTASFPFLVSTNENSQTVGLALSGGGAVPPLTMPAGISGDSGGVVNAYNYGNGIYYPTARIYGPVENPALKNETLGLELDLNITLSAGEYIDVDFKRKTVTDQSGSNRYSIKSGDWWYLTPSNNVIKFLAETYDATAQATLYWRDSYLGI